MHHDLRKQHWCSKTTKNKLEYILFHFLSLNRTKHDSVAQLVEQYTFNVWVLGSNPSGITKASKEAFTFKVRLTRRGGEIGRHATLRW